MAINPVSFQAAWPKSLYSDTYAAKMTNFFWNAISLFVFPIGLARLAYRQIQHLSFSPIVPGPKQNVEEQGKKLLKKFSGENIQIHTPDGAKLDGAFFQGSKKNKAILYAGGNAQAWEQQASKVEMLAPLGPSILLVNPRGVKKSTGWRSSQGYALDYYSAFEYLVNEKGISPENILVVGFSMGGANGVCGADLIQKKYPERRIGAINLCSFSSLNKMIRAHVGIFLATFARMFNIEIDVSSPWKNLTGEKVIFYRPGDEIIPRPSSLHRQEKANRTYQLLSSDHNAPFTSEEKFTLQEEVCRLLKIPMPWLHFFNPKELEAL